MSEKGNRKNNIAILTSYYINNYGSVLQAYATNYFFKSLGLDVIFIDYIRDNVRNRKIVNPKWNNSFIKKVIYHIYSTIDTALKSLVFNSFLKQNLSFTTTYIDKESLFNAPPLADYYCVGSDQMWNSEYNGGLLSENYLAFVPSDKRKFSFSTSIGMESISETELQSMKQLLDEFEVVSVREENSKHLLLDAGLSNVRCDLDPTLLVPQEHWLKLVNSQRSRHKKYILIYQLNSSSLLRDYARKLANQYDLDIIQITYYMSQHWSGIHSVYLPTVKQFLSLINNAEFIITDSFHGTAFSINLNKEFFCFAPPKYYERIGSILSVTGLEDRLINDIKTYSYSSKINYDKVNQILSEKRNSTFSFYESLL